MLQAFWYPFFHAKMTLGFKRHKMWHPGDYESLLYIPIG